MKALLYLVTLGVITTVSLTLIDDYSKARQSAPPNVMKFTLSDLNRLTYLKDHETGKYYMIFRSDSEVLIHELPASEAETRIINPK